MSRCLALSLAASCAINLAMVFLGRGSFHQGLVVVLIMLVALPILGIGALILRFGASPDSRRFAKYVIAFGCAAGSSLISLPIGSIVNWYDIEQARAFCDRLRPELERHRQRTGRYPERLPHEVVRGLLPRLLRDREFYRPSGTFYTISFIDPSGMLNGLDFDSRTGEWSEWD